MHRQAQLRSLAGQRETWGADLDLLTDAVASCAQAELALQSEGPRGSHPCSDRGSTPPAVREHRDIARAHHHQHRAPVFQPIHRHRADRRLHLARMHHALELVDRSEEAGDERIPGTLEDLDRRRILNETPPVQHHDTVREKHRLLRIVGDHESARIRAFEPPQRLHADLLPEVLVEPGEGLVEEQHLRPRRERPKQGDALLLTARQGVRIALREVFETHLAQNPPHPRITARVGPRDSEGHVLTHREVGKERVVLEHESDATRFRGDLARLAPLGHETFSDPDPARLQRLEPGCETQHRGLATS